MHKAGRTRRIFAAAIFATVLAAGAAAADERRPLPGEPTAPPPGFLDLCSRAPTECYEPGVPPHETQARARALFWSSILGDGVASPASVAERPRLAQRSGKPTDLDRVSDRRGPDDGSSRPPSLARTALGLAALDSHAPPHPPIPVSNPVAAWNDGGGVSTTITMTAAHWAAMDRLNRDVNRRIRRASDQRLYGAGDHWTIPSGADPRGDCEDYVLAKRRALIEQGYPQEAFSIALVETPWGESHAVLLMATSEGELVLDNLTPRILRTTEVAYQWRKRQVPGRALAWVSGL